MLNTNIKEFFDIKHKSISNAEILSTAGKYNPYFSVKGKNDREKYKNNRDTYIFDYVDFSQITEEFIKNFQYLNFETMFEENINDYIKNITDKIKDIQTFGNIIRLIDINRIKTEKQKDYFRILKEKYKINIKNDIKFIKGETELNVTVKILAEFISKIFLFEKK
jgi:hypothetical protein